MERVSNLGRRSQNNELERLRRQLDNKYHSMSGYSFSVMRVSAGLTSIPNLF